MPHDIEIFEDGSAAFVSAREAAWHWLGTVVDEAMNASEVLEISQLAGWDIRLSQLYIMDGGETQAVPDRFATVRTNPVSKAVEPLGLVSDHYQVFQNEELAEVLDTVVDVSGAHFETAGSLRNGRRVFVNMKLPGGFTVAGKDTEKHELYLLGTTTHDGKSKIQFAVTPVRVVCKNTLTAGLRSMVSGYGISHKGDLKVKVQDVRDGLEMQIKAVDDFQAEAERMLDNAFTDREFAELTRTLWGKPQSAAAERREDKLNWLWHEASTLGGIRGTNWGAWQAITEYVDHYDAPTGTAANRALRSVDGAGLARKEAAYKLLAV